MPDHAMPDTAPDTPPAARWRSLRRHGLINFLVCCGIAVWLSVLAGGHWLANLVYSQAIGMLCWLVIDAGRLLVAHELARRHPDTAEYAQGWPGWRWMGAIIVLGVPLAYLAGSLLGGLLVKEVSSLPGQPGGETSHPGGLGFMLILSFTVAALMVGFMYARNALLSVRAEAETVRRLATETQLKLLQSQLEPHMLFNTLANLRVLIGLDPPRAQAMLDHLIAFLRATLTASRHGGLQPLQAEFARIEDYLALMGIRMGARLHSTLVLPATLREHPVPPLLLQPLVENAIQHGLEPKIDGGRIEVCAAAEADRLVLTVRDTGVGLADATRPDTASAGSIDSFGLTQIRARLAALHGAQARLTLQTADDAEGGTLARIELPLVPTMPTTIAAQPHHP
jgi:signal transduction histidine kinase